jgi:predicted RNase H-like HicB family nuclease
MCYPQTMRLMVELDREADGRWIAEVVDLPGVLVYGATREEALASAQALALRVVADKLEHGEAPAVPLDLSFVINAA